MGKYRKKPVTIEAVQWWKNGDHPSVEPLFIYDLDHSSICNKCGEKIKGHGRIDTLEGGHIVCPGDYIITGIKGEEYPCKPDIFKETYEEEV
jgi:hypothetical protein